MTIARTSTTEGQIHQQQQREEDNDVDESPALILLSAGGESCCVSEQHYVNSGNEKIILFVLCIGLNREGDSKPLFSFEREPWSLLPKASILRPKNTDFVNEVRRRASLFNVTPIPRPSNWRRGQMLEWLEQNPVHDNSDIQFLTNEVLRLQEVLMRAQQQDFGTTSGDDSGRGGRAWRGLVPYLRVIMCLTQDNVKCLYLTRANTRSRQELDSRNSENR